MQLSRFLGLPVVDAGSHPVGTVVDVRLTSGCGQTTPDTRHRFATRTDRGVLFGLASTPGNPTSGEIPFVRPEIRAGSGSIEELDRSELTKWAFQTDPRR